MSCYHIYLDARRLATINADADHPRIYNVSNCVKRYMIAESAVKWWKYWSGRWCVLWLDGAVGADVPFIHCAEAILYASPLLTIVDEYIVMLVISVSSPISDHVFFARPYTTSYLLLNLVF